jgi:hypothetical protein
MLDSSWIEVVEWSLSGWLVSWCWPQEAAVRIDVDEERSATSMREKNSLSMSRLASEHNRTELH